MGDEERAPQWAVVGIQAVLGKDLLVMVEVVVIDRPVERHYDHLRRLESFDHRDYVNSVSLRFAFSCDRSPSETTNRDGYGCVRYLPRPAEARRE